MYPKPTPTLRSKIRAAVTAWLREIGRLPQPPHRTVEIDPHDMALPQPTSWDLDGPINGGRDQAIADQLARLRRAEGQP